MDQVVIKALAEQRLTLSTGSLSDKARQAVNQLWRNTLDLAEVVDHLVKNKENGCIARVSGHRFWMVLDATGTVTVWNADNMCTF